jgi:hypothetical protein
MSNRVNGDFQHGDEEVHGDADSASVPTPPPSTFPPSTSSGYPNQQLSTASAYPVQRVNFDGEARVTMSRDEREEAGLHDVPIISENVDLTSLSESQLDDYVRQAKDMYSDLFPEGREPLIQTDRAMILLAKNVTDSVFESRFLPIPGRYLLDENLDLYIRKVPGRCHSRVHSRVNGDCFVWQNGQGLLRSLDLSDAEKNDYAGKKLEPDVAIFALSDGANSSPRCIIEIEVHHQSPREGRELAEVYFRNPNVRCIVLLKVWNRRADGTFAAACIVWVRGEDEGIECHAAHDFGTAPINLQARNSLSGVNEDPPLPIPFVPADMQYLVPTPDRRPIADRNAQDVEILASTITVNATNEHGEPLDGLDPPIENLQLDLSVYAELIERILE